jgi:2'-5' RNA ligase
MLDAEIVGRKNRVLRSKSRRNFPPHSAIFSRADVAQLVEQPIRNRQVSSSSLDVGSISLKTKNRAN